LIQLKNILKIALFIGAFFLMPLLSSAQKSVLELLPGADKLGYDAKTGAHRLTGSVNFIYQGNTMYCDSAHYFDKTNEVRAYGNVHITKDDINLFCDSLYYNGKTRKAKLWGHVRVRDSEYKITTDTLEYDAKKAQGIYRHGGKIESIVSNEVLTSRIGYFYPQSRSFFFSGKVKYKNDDLSMSTDTLQYTYSKQTTYFFGPTKIVRGKTTMFCERGWYNVVTEEGSLIRNAEIYQDSKTIKGDTLLYQPLKGRSIGKGHVYFKDTAQSIEFYGDYAINSDTNNYSYLTGHALAKRIQNKDTIYIHADTLFNQNDSLGKALFVRGSKNVKIFHNDIQAQCDSLHFEEPKGIMEMHYSPIIWAKNAELKGKKMTVYIVDSLIDHIFIEENATAIMEIDTGNYYNQIAGKEMTAYMKNNELVRSDVNGTAKTIFYPQDEEKTDTSFTIKRLGMNRLYASDLRVYLDSGEVIGVTYFDKPDGVFYPMSKINKEEQFISNFEWNPFLRPKTWMEIVH
jgi:lipopolysaccharide assembly outer membrane protein LptD (OstA)